MYGNRPASDTRWPTVFRRRFPPPDDATADAQEDTVIEPHVQRPAVDSARESGGGWGRAVPNVKNGKNRPRPDFLLKSR